MLLHKVKSSNSREVLIAGSFAPDTANPPTGLLGVGFTVARSGTGEFTVTFATKFPSLIAGAATLELNSADDKFLQLGPYDSSAGTLKIRNWDISGAAVADIAAHANNRVNFVCIFER